jgi:DNA-binding NarL/FixJ family response regulator
MSAPPIRVALADDHAVVRHGLRSLLALAPDIQLAFEACDGADAIAQCRALPPTVLLLDVRMPNGDGLHVLRTLAAASALPPTLVLTTFDDEDVALEAIRCGARGFLLKDVSLERLLAAIRTLAAGGTFHMPAPAARNVTAPKSYGSEGTLTPRELSVLRLMAGGYSNREIGKALSLSEGTVKNHVSSILDKLGVRDRTRAVLKALADGVV